MAEIIQRDGTWTFDGATLRIVPGHDKSVGLLRTTTPSCAACANWASCTGRAY